MRLLRLEVSVYYVYVTNQFQATFARGVRGVGGVTVNSKEKTLKAYVTITSKNSASGLVEHDGYLFVRWECQVFFLPDQSANVYSRNIEHINIRKPWYFLVTSITVLINEYAAKQT